MKQFSLLIGIVLLLPSIATALPILSESEDGMGRLATILPDHEDKKTRYFFPNMGGPQMNSAGEPRFAMSYWDANGNVDGGGFMSGIFGLAVGGELKDAIKENREKGFKVSVIPVQRSYIRFMQNAEGERVMEDIFKEVDIPPFSGRPEDSIGISASLTGHGGKAIAQQLLATGYAAKLDYCYVVKGVSPVFDAKITMNYKKVYTHFAMQASGGRWWYKWSIRKEVEKLIESRDIKIEINGGDATKYDYMMALADRMVTRFMVPVLENRRVPASGKYGISHTTIIEDREETFQVKQREIIDREYCVALGMDEIKRFPWLVVKVQ